MSTSAMDRGRRTFLLTMELQSTTRHRGGVASSGSGEAACRRIGAKPPTRTSGSGGFVFADRTLFPSVFAREIRRILMMMMIHEQAGTTIEQKTINKVFLARSKKVREGGNEGIM